MGFEPEYDYLESLPTYIFQDLVERWQKKTLELKPNGLLSEDNRDKVIEIVNDLKISQSKHLTKVAENFDLSSVWWQAYSVERIKPLVDLYNRQKSFNVTPYVTEEGKAKGRITSTDLSEQATFIIAESSSRIATLRKRFRFIYFPTVKLVLMEHFDLCEIFFKNEILPYISKEDKFIKKPIRARLIKSFAKYKDDPMQRITLTDLKIKISLETSGIEGLNQIIIQGDDVIRGAETLEQRHEISLKFMNSGPWVAAGTQDFQFEVSKGVKIHRLENSSLKKLLIVLSWL